MKTQIKFLILNFLFFFSYTCIYNLSFNKIEVIKSTIIILFNIFFWHFKLLLLIFFLLKYFLF
jgi:hypothetical protein